MEEDDENMGGLITVDCGKYGIRKVHYNPNNSQYIADELYKQWKNYWPGIQGTYESNLRANDVPGTGTLEMLKGGWEFYVDDDFSDLDPMPEGHIFLSLVFLVDQKEGVPIWDITLEYGKVTHCQPVF